MNHIRSLSRNAQHSNHRIDIIKSFAVKNSKPSPQAVRLLPFSRTYNQPGLYSLFLQYTMSQTITNTLTLPTVTAEEAFMAPLPELHLQPLWTQMSKMVPPGPNPTSVPVKWAYKKCKPLLMEAGEIVGAEQAERRVLMLVNPSMGNTMSLPSVKIKMLITFRYRCTVHNRHNLRRSATYPAR